MTRIQTISAIALVSAMTLVVGKGCALRPDLKVSRKFQEAQAIFDEAASPDDFMHAAAVYQEILDSGVRSGAVFFNQGNALMRAGQAGRAIAAYRQAERFRPGDPYIEANLQYALGNGPEEAGRARPLFEYVLFWQDWISYAGKFRLLGAAAVATFLLACIGLFVPSRLPSRLAVAALVVTAVLAVSAGYDWSRFERVKHGVIVENDVVARKGNNNSYKPAFTKPLEDGTEFSVLERRGDWIFIRLPGNQEGWVEDKAAVVY